MRKGHVTSASGSGPLFQPFRIGALRLRNRVVALPVYTGYAHPGGAVSDLMIDAYARLAATGAAVVTVANVAVSADGCVSPYNLRIDQDAFLPGLRNLAAAIRDQGAVACLQLNHAGMFAKTERPLLPAPMDASHLAFHFNALLEFLEGFHFENRLKLMRYLIQQIHSWRSGMDGADIRRVVSDFARAAARAHRAGFDMVELHGANGYLLCQFLSGFTNRRAPGESAPAALPSDLPLRVIRAVKRALPEGFPVGYRIILREWVPDGIDLPDALAFAARLEQAKIAYLSASAGSYYSLFSPRVQATIAKPGYLRGDAARLMQAVGLPVIISGRILTPKLAGRLITAGAAHLVGLGRPLRTDPDWLRKAAAPREAVRACVNCNGCLRRVILDQGFACTLWPRRLQERIAFRHKLLDRGGAPAWVISSHTDLAFLETPQARLASRAAAAGGKNRLILLLLAPERMDGSGRTLRECTADFARREAERSGIDLQLRPHLPRAGSPPAEHLVCHLAEQYRWATVFLRRTPDLPHRSRLLYKIRGRAVGLIGDPRRPEHILVPVDLSDTTLLLLHFLTPWHRNDADITIDFLHVHTGASESPSGRWQALLAVAGYSPEPPLLLTEQRGGVAASLMEAAEAGDYGTIVMGKRGLSGIKRWLLGSVSAGVLRRLTRQSLILVD